MSGFSEGTTSSPHPHHPNAWFAAAYGGNGVSFGVLAAEIILEEVLGGEHPHGAPRGAP